MTSLTLYSNDKENHVSLTAGKVPSYRAHAYSGGKLFVEQFELPVVLDLTTIEGGKVENFLRHDLKLKAGNGEIEIFPTHVEARGKLDVDGEAKAEILAAKNEGKRWQVSIGAKDFKTELVADGDRRIINGRTQVGPFYHARGGQIVEVSFVDEGGDVENHVSLAAKHKKGVTEMSKTLDSGLKEFAKEIGIENPAELNEKAIEVLTAAFNAPTPKKETEPEKKGEKVPSELESLRAELKAERKAFRDDIQRSESIRTLCASYGHPNVEIGEGDKKRTVSLFAHATENGWDLDKVELNAKLWKLQQEEKSGEVDIRNNYAGFNLNESETNEVLTAAALLNNNGEKEVGETFNASRREKVMNEATSGRFRDLSVVDLCRMSLQAMGKPYRGFGHSQDFAQYVIQQHRQHELTASAGWSSVSLVNILENTMNKTLLMSFRRTPSTWQDVAHTYSASDYKSHSFYRLTSKGGFLPVGSNGQIEHASLEDSKATASVDDYGMIITFSAKMIVNDDMNALSTIGNSIGSMAARKIDEELYESLLTWSALTGITSTPLSYGALQAIDDHFDALLDADNKPIDMPWDTLIVPNTYKRLAMKFASEENMAGIAQDASASSDVKDNAIGRNEFAGRFKAVHSKWISPKLVSGNDPKNTKGKKLSTPAAGNYKYFALCGPEASSEYQAMRVGFLNGQRTPRVTSGSLAFDVEGIGYKALFDFGVDRGDAEAIVEIRSGA